MMSLSKHSKQYALMGPSEEQASFVAANPVTNIAVPRGDGFQYAPEIVKTIAKYHQNHSALCSLASGGIIGTAIGVPAVYIKGESRIAYPVCQEQLATIVSISSPVGDSGGSSLEQDASHCRSWQIDSSLVMIEPIWLADSLPRLVNQCCDKLGIDPTENNVRARLNKLLALQEGGRYYTTHLASVKNSDSLGSLLVQLPASFQGGHLVVTRDDNKKRFQFDKESGDKAFYVAYSAGCECVLEPIVGGCRLVLMFDLVPGLSVAPVLPQAAHKPASSLPSNHNLDLEDSLQRATKAWCEDESAVQKFVLPLAHKYPRGTVTFASLKGADLHTAHLLQSTISLETNRNLFSVHLAQVTKHWTGPDENNDYDETETTAYRIDTWLGPHGPESPGALVLDFDLEDIAKQACSTGKEKADKSVFAWECDRSENDRMQGTNQTWHHATVLVIWPAKKEFEIKLKAELVQAIEMMYRMNRSSPEFEQALARLLDFLPGAGAGTWQPTRVLPLMQTLAQTTAVLELCFRLKLVPSDAVAVVEEVGRHGWAPLVEAFTKVLESQTPAVMVVMLRLLRQQSSSSPSGSPAAVSSASWEGLMRVLMTKLAEVLQPPSSAPAAPAIYFHAGTVVFASQAILLTDDEWCTVSRFIVTHCEPQDQETVVARLGSCLDLHSLNHIVEAMPHGEGLVQEKLRAFAVEKCKDDKQRPEEIAAALDWIVRGSHTQMLVSLRETLQGLSHSPNLFRALFALPCVLEELKKDSPMSAQLEGLLMTRIAAVKPHIVAPPFSWRMAPTEVVTNDPRVGPFLASDQQTIVLDGFRHIEHARRLVGQFHRGVYKDWPVRATESGAGPRSTVTLTKNMVVHEKLVQSCAENATELRALQNILRARGRDFEENNSSSTVNSQSYRPAGNDESELPVQKKARIEPEVIVIDD